MEHRQPDAARWFLLVAALGLVAFTFRDYGAVWDEGWHVEYGRRILAWWSSGLSDRSVLGYRDLGYYGGLFDAVAEGLARVWDLGPFATRHLFGGFVGWIGIAVTGRLAGFLAGRSAGWIAMLTLFCTPAYYGHAFNNPKDVPFAVACVVALDQIVRGAAAPRLGWGRTFAIGLAIGAALAVRVPGLYLVGLWALASAVAWLRSGRLRGEAPSGALRAWLPRFAVGLAVACTVMVLAWPEAFFDPLRHPIRTLQRFADVPWNGTVLFEGEQVRAADLPHRYVPELAVLTLPEHFLLALAAAGTALALFVRHRGWRTAGEDSREGSDPLPGWTVVTLAALAPAAWATLTAATLYDGLRHLLFVVPPLAVVAAGGVVSCLRRLAMRGRLMFGGALALGLGATSLDMIDLHPHQYLYYNRLVAGGLAGVAGRHELDYWGNAYREGVDWITGRFGDLPGPIRVAACSDPISTRPFLSPPFVFVEDQKSADLVLASTRWNCDRLAPGRVIHRVTRQGVPILVVKRPGHR